jgi:hypothetical protein
MILSYLKSSAPEVVGALFCSVLPCIEVLTHETIRWWAFEFIFRVSECMNRGEVENSHLEKAHQAVS